MSTPATPIPAADPVTPASSVSPLVPLLNPHEDVVRYEDRFLSKLALARWLGVSTSRLDRWFAQDFGPPRFRLGKSRVAYRLGDILDFVRSRPADLYPDTRRKARKPKTESSSEA
jgi:predicted DNA-binding transcriptional regulator AlpA